MVEVNVSRELDVDIDKVWALLENFGDISWMSGPEKVEVIGAGVGMTRRLYITGLAPIDEILTSINPGTREMTYIIPKNKVIPFENYNARVVLHETITGGTGIDWSCTLDSGKMPAADAHAMMEGTFNMLIDSLAKAVAR